MIFIKCNRKFLGCFLRVGLLRLEMFFLVSFRVIRSIIRSLGCGYWCDNGFVFFFIMFWMYIDIYVFKLIY